MTQPRTVALVKQVPRGDLALGADARLMRGGQESEMNPWCRRAVAQAVRLGQCTAITMGPPAAVDVMREAGACGVPRAVHLCDPLLAGSDCLATAKALAAAVTRVGPTDLVLVGHSSTDGSTGAVGAMVAELLGWPFIGPALEITLEGDTLHTRLQTDGGIETVAVRLPAVVAVAERSCEPAKAHPDLWPDETTVERWTTADLGDRFHAVPSPTEVVGVRHTTRDRRRLVLDGDVATQVRRALELLDRREPNASPPALTTPVAVSPSGQAILVLSNASDESGRRALLGEVAALAGGPVISIGPGAGEVAQWGADEQIVLDGAEPRPVAEAIGTWITAHGMPWAVVGGSTSWERDVLSRLAVALDAGLMSDLIGIEVRDGRLVGLKTTGTGVLAEIASTGPTQIATVRTGTLSPRAPRRPRPIPQSTLPVRPDPAITRFHYLADDDYDALDRAETVIGVGLGVPPEEYGDLEALRAVLGAEFAATRKVTDRGWLPHSRQLGITARSIAPKLYVAIGLSGNPNHSVGVGRAQTVLAINTDPDAPIFDHSDIGLVADWREVVPLLVTELTNRQATSAAGVS